jgi:RNA polymerase sigma-70 factor (ECF subfamily)
LLARISGSDRALLEMMYSEEMSIAEIAELLGMSQANVKVRAWRARHALRKVLRAIM